MSQLSLYDYQRDSFAGHFDRAGMPELMRRKPATNPGGLSSAPQLASHSSRGAWPAAGRAPQYAEQCADGQGRAELEPGIEMLPRPAVHPNLAPPAALPGANQDRAALPVEIGLGQRERFADP
jgi:hypothetical protein